MRKLVSEGPTLHDSIYIARLQGPGCGDGERVSGDDGFREQREGAVVGKAAEGPCGQLVCPPCAGGWAPTRVIKA